MSDKLSISAALSVLMMSAYVLLGGDASRQPLGPSGDAGLAAPLEIAAPELSRLDRLVLLAR